jgi:hypothetical protein
MYADSGGATLDAMISSNVGSGLAPHASCCGHQSRRLPMTLRFPVTLLLLALLFASPAAAQARFEWRAGEQPARDVQSDRWERRDVAADRLIRQMRQTADRISRRVNRAIDRVHARTASRSARLAERLHNRLSRHAWHLQRHRH